MLKRAMLPGIISTGVDVADLRVLPSAVNRHLLKSEGFDGAMHVGISPADPRSSGSVLRASGHPADGRAAEGDREALHAPRDAARRGRRASGRSAIRRARARATRRSCSRRSTSTPIRERALPDRRRLRLLGRVVRPAARARPARRRGGGGARVHRPTSAGRRPRCASAIGQTKNLVARGRRRPRRRLRPRRRAALPDRRAAHEMPVEQALLLYLRLIELERAAREARLPDHRHEPGRAARRGERARDRAHAGLARGADAGRGARTASSSPARSAAATSSRSSCRPTTRSRACASCSSCSRRSSGRSRSLSPSCRASTLVHRQLAVPWALKGTVMRVLTERFARPRASTSPTGSRSSTSAAGRGAARPGRAARPHLRRGTRRDDESDELEARAARLVEGIMQGRRLERRSARSLKLRLTLSGR